MFGFSFAKSRGVALSSAAPDVLTSSGPGLRPAMKTSKTARRGLRTKRLGQSGCSELMIVAIV